MPVYIAFSNPSSLNCEEEQHFHHYHLHHHPSRQQWCFFLSIKTRTTTTRKNVLPLKNCPSNIDTGSSYSYCPTPSEKYFIIFAKDPFFFFLTKNGAAPLAPPDYQSNIYPKRTQPPKQIINPGSIHYFLKNPLKF